MHVPQMFGDVLPHGLFQLCPMVCNNFRTICLEQQRLTREAHQPDPLTSYLERQHQRQRQAVEHTFWRHQDFAVEYGNPFHQFGYEQPERADSRLREFDPCQQFLEVRFSAIQTAMDFGVDGRLYVGLSVDGKPTLIALDIPLLSVLYVSTRSTQLSG